MLLYFSATGNGKYLADRLCEREPQERKSIPDCMRAGEFSFSMENKKPVRSKEKCTLCLGCLHRCPVFAIQYGKHTKAHGQYVNHMRDTAR